MKKWTEADVIELSIKATFQNGSFDDYDGPIEGTQDLGFGTDVPESGTVVDARFFGNTSGKEKER